MAKWNDAVNYEIEGEGGVRITCVPLSSVESLVERIKKDYEAMGHTEKEIMLPFEFIIGSLFPNAFNNIKETMTQEYIAGFQDGVAEGLKNKETE
jgi:hypothetical protein